MDTKDKINVTLFLLVACLALIASQGAFNSKIWSKIFFDIGIAMFGGIVCGLTLYGSDVIHKTRPRDEKHFLTVKRNQDLGEEFWMDLIDQIGRSPSTLWFVGNHHLTWIDRGLSYRNQLAHKLIERVEACMKSKRPDGWEVIIILSDKNAAKQWEEFVKSEVTSAVNYEIKRPNLIKIGVVAPEKISYSIVAYDRGIVVTTYLSSGRTAESPSMSLRLNSTVAKLYLDDLWEIRKGVDPSNWLNLDDKKE